MVGGNSIVNLTFTNEVIYEFKYQNYTQKLYHWVDNIEQRRYFSVYENLTNGFPEPLNLKGTGANGEIVEAELIAVYELTGEPRVLYYLPDIIRYVIAKIAIYDGNVIWTFDHLDQLNAE